MEFVAEAPKFFTSDENTTCFDKFDRFNVQQIEMTRSRTPTRSSPREKRIKPRSTSLQKSHLGIKDRYNKVGEATATTSSSSRKVGVTPDVFLKHQIDTRDNGADKNQAPVRLSLIDQIKLEQDGKVTSSGSIFTGAEQAILVWRGMAFKIAALERMKVYSRMSGNDSSEKEFLKHIKAIAAELRGPAARMKLVKRSIYDEIPPTPQQADKTGLLRYESLPEGGFVIESNYDTKVSYTSLPSTCKVRVRDILYRYRWR